MKKPRWTPSEDQIIRDFWEAQGGVKAFLHLLPGRTQHAIYCRAEVFLKLPSRIPLNRARHSFVSSVTDDLLKTGYCGTTYEIAEKTRASHQRTRTMLREGHGTKYHIAGWKKCGGSSNWVAVWRFGPGADVPKPLPKEGKENSHEYRERRKIRQGKVNPFATLVSQVTDGEKITPNGKYQSRIFKEAA